MTPQYITDKHNINEIIQKTIELAIDGQEITESEVIDIIQKLMTNSVKQKEKEKEVIENKITATYDNQELTFSPLLWLSILKLNSIVLELLDAYRKKQIEFDFSSFKQESETYKQYLSADLFQIIQSFSCDSDIENDFVSVDSEEEFEFVDNKSDNHKEINPYENWDTDKGFDPYIYLNLMQQMAKRGESLFALNNLYATTLPNIQTEVESFIFNTNDDQKKVFYFMPLHVYFDAYEKKQEFNAIDNPQVDAHIKYIKECCRELTKPTRFIIPLFEVPLPKGVHHSILMCVDYDPINNKLTPMIYDSLTRGFINQVSKWVRWTQHQTCNKLMRNAFEKIFAETDFTVDTLKRCAYGHQNRVIEGNCGAYTFCLAHIAADEFMNKTNILDKFEASIPKPNGYITADNLLTPEHVAEITAIVKENNSQKLDPLKNLQKVDIALRKKSKCGM